MGKFEEEESSLSSSDIARISALDQNADTNNPCRNISKFVHFRCVIALLFSAAVFLSVIFWVPPLYHYRDRTHLDPNSLLEGHDVVAVFKLQKPVSLLNANIQLLEYDIFEVIGVSSSTVNVLSLEPLDESNSTNVMFAVDPNMNYTHISSASLSLLKSTFVSLVTQQQYLHLSPSLFDDASSFEVLKFEGGITVVPLQRAFLLQKVQSLFNFTLNFSIHQIQQNFDELKDQLKSGLHLNSHENLYISLTNEKGSTVAHNTTIQTTVLLSVGNNPPPLPRLKQLARTIKGSHDRNNLGLNNTVFGKVKQVTLSSIVEHPLNGGGSSPSPSPAPMPLPSGRQHHLHHHHHHHHNHRSHPPETHHELPEAPGPAPQEAPSAKPPSGCQVGCLGKNKHCNLPPTVSPTVSPRYHGASPSPNVQPPAPAPQFVPASSPVPAVVFAPVPKSSENKPNIRSTDVTPSVSPMPSPISTGGHISSVRWSLAVFLPLLVARLLT